MSLKMNAIYNSFNSSNPSSHVKELVSLNLDPIIIKKLDKPIHAMDLYRDGRKLGSEIVDLEFPFFRNRWKERSLDNRDLVIGYGRLYADLTHYLHIRRNLKALHGIFEEDYNAIKTSKPYLWQSEQDSFNKVSAQRLGGRNFIRLPYPLDLKISDFDPGFLKCIDAVFKRYKKVMPTNINWLDAAFADIEPDDTNTGLPLLVSKENTVPGRILTCLALPQFTWKVDDIDRWFDKCDHLGSSLYGFPPGMMNSSVIGYRTSTKVKPFPLFYPSEYGFSAINEQSGIYGFLRLIFMAPYHINIPQSQAYLMCSAAERLIPGLYHDPDGMMASIKRFSSILSSDKSLAPYALDFSNMDGTMSSELIKIVCDLAISNNFAPEAFLFLKKLYERLAIIFPSWLNDPMSVTIISKVLMWLSGLKMTSKMDTIIGQAVHLYMKYKSQGSSVFDRFINMTDPTLLAMHQGDDTLFVDRKDRDKEVLKDIGKEVGFELKIEDDITFLQKKMPVVSDIQQVKNHFELASHSWRIIGNTFYNEKKLDGKPDAIIKLGCVARILGGKTNPLFMRRYDLYFGLLNTCPFMQTMPKEQFDRWKTGDVYLTANDLADIQMYAEKDPSYMQDLILSIDYKPASLEVVKLLKSYGFDLIDPIDKALKHRAECVQALSTVPPAGVHRQMIAMTGWLR